MGIPRRKHDPAGPLPKGLYRHRATYRARGPGGKWVTFGPEFANAVADYAYFREHQTRPIKPLEPIAKHLYRTLRKNARTRDLAVQIDLNDVTMMLKRADGRCEVTGIAFSDTKPLGARMRPWCPSIDRIDGTRGYATDNCRVVCAYVNVVLNEFGDDHFARLAYAFIQQRRRKNCSKSGNKAKIPTASLRT